MQLPADPSSRYSNGMDRWSLHNALLLVAALMVAMSSVVSASRMMPNRAVPAMAGQMAAGGPHASHHARDPHGGDGSSHDDHQCPFCRLLSDPPDIRITPGLRRTPPSLVWQSLGHLIARAQARNPHVSARAPPVPV